MSDAAALVRAASNTGKIAGALKNQWDVRSKTRATLENGAAMEMVIRSQIDEVFLVLAHLGEAILPLGIFNKDYYLQTLGEVQASIDSCGNELFPMAWAELDAELQYVCTAGFTICACYSPMPVYRGFGACVLGDWDWACPDLKHLEEKAQKKAIRTIYGFKQKVDPQPTRSVFIAFDQVIQILQVKVMAFLEKRPMLSSFSDHQARFQSRQKKEVKDDLDVFEDWVKQLERRGHPAPKGTKLSSWGIPYATWTSPYSCHVLKTEKDCETIMCNQMDPGRLLHSFVCRGGLNLDQGQVLLLPPRSPAESLASWLEGLPGTSHKVAKWEDLDTERFEAKISKSLRKKIGRYPLPVQYAIRDPQAGARSSQAQSMSSPNLLEHPSTVSPPPYSPSTTNSMPNRTAPVAELGHPDPRELPASPIPSSQSQPHHASSLPVPGAASSGLKSIHTLRRKTTGGAPNGDSSETGQRPKSDVGQEPKARENPAPNAIELPEETARSNTGGSSSSFTAVELPTEYQSEAPKGLSPSSPKPVELPSESKTDDEHKETTVEQSKNEPTVLSEEPESIIVDTAVEPQPKSSGSTSSATAGNQYLDLLNKVAKGEISPQALSQILATGDLSLTSEDAPNAEAITTSSAAKTESASSKAPQSTSEGLPYPLSPTEREKNAWLEQEKSATGVPYPSSPTDTDSNTTRQADGSKDSDVPASLRPGAQ